MPSPKPDPREPQITDRIRGLIQKYDRRSLLSLALKHPNFTWAGIELLAVAIANNPTGSEERVPEATLNQLIAATEESLVPTLGEEKKGGELLFWLRKTRGMHPVWYAAPLFAEILSPFNKELEAQIGHTSEKIFGAVTALAEEQPVTRLPEELNELHDQMIIPIEECSSPSALWNVAIIEADRTAYVLTNKLAEVTYRILNDKLRNVNKFTNRKGKAIERFARRRLEPLMPKWRWESNYFLGGREKDLIGIGTDAGVAVECKGFNFATSAVTWSNLNAVRDASGVVKALEQIEQPLALLKQGGRLGSPAIPIQPKKVVQGIVMTDNVYTPYVRASLDAWVEENPGEKWHGKDVWVASMVDLDFVVRATRRMSVMLDYLAQVRAHPNIRLTPEPEAFLMYTVNRNRSGVW